MTRREIIKAHTDKLDFAMFDLIARTPAETAEHRQRKAAAHSKAAHAYYSAQLSQRNPHAAAASARIAAESMSLRVGMQAALRTIGRDQKRGQRFNATDYTLAARLASRQIIGL